MLRQKMRRIADSPAIYRLSQALLAPRARPNIQRLLKRRLPSNRFGRERALDVGCGPSSYLSALGLNPVGIDISEQHLREYCKPKGRTACRASADKLPFKNESFDIVCSVGVLHHLSEGRSKDAVAEMMRVCGRNGSVIILDAVLPGSFRARPLAWILRKNDRGRFVRDEAGTLEILPDRRSWKVERHVYTLTGLECLLMVFRRTWP